MADDADDADEADKGGDADYARRLIAQRIPETNRAGFRARRERRIRRSRPGRDRRNG